VWRTPHTSLRRQRSNRDNDKYLQQRSIALTDSTEQKTDTQQRPLRLGTRGSPLARWQAEYVASELQQRGYKTEFVIITTSGDVTDRSLSEFGGVGVFTKEIQRALLAERIDLAVHSLKDLPTEAVAGLTLAAVPPRESPFDVLIARNSGSFDDLASAARIGTGSRRRQSQILHLRPDLHLSEIRGNVETRLRKLDEGEFDAIVLAQAGLNRLGLSNRITQVLPPSIVVPAVGQGALGIETRADDARTMAAVHLLDDPATHRSVLVERELLARLRGGCLAPVGAWARQVGENLRLSAVVLSADGRRRISITLAAQADDPQQLGQQAAEELLEMGAAELIAGARE
jgi:hydroxymethylbilane synthase